MKILIMTCSGDYWYKDKIGKTFKVYGTQGGVMNCKKYVIKVGKLFKEVLARDCEVI
jgi:hypothetical protein